MALEQEIETYRKKLPELLGHKGKFVVIYGANVLGFFDGFEDALKVGYEQAGNDEFLVRKVSDTEQVLVSSWSLRPCPTSPVP